MFAPKLEDFLRILLANRKYSDVTENRGYIRCVLSPNLYLMLRL